MIHIVLIEPQIPPNTGNIIRLCANTGAHLHLIEPLGFALDHKQMRRAGLDYHEFAQMQVHTNWDAFCQKIPVITERIFVCTTHGKRCYAEVNFKANDVLVFGSESKGLDPDFRNQFPEDQRLRIPMLKHSRSLNLSNSVAIMVFEAWRQLQFINGN